MSLDLKKTENNIKLKLKLEAINNQVSIFDILELFNLPHQGKFEQQLSCPLHEDKKPSARVYSNTNTFYCFSCASFLNPVSMTKRLLQAQTTTEAVDYLIRELGLVVEDMGDLSEKIRKVAEKGTVSSYKAYHEIEKMIAILFSNGKALEKYNELDKVFYGVDKNHEILLPDYQKIYSSILS